MATKQEMQDRIAELEDDNKLLSDKLDEISSISAADDEGDQDGDDEDDE
ncbi:MAG: hypothetical protein ACRD2E_03030 [Terriglobales bacterium]